MRKFICSLAVLGAVTLVPAIQNVKAEATPARHASAVLQNVSGDVVGTARFVEDDAGKVHISVHASGLSTGLHGIHVHTVGSCVTGTTAFDGAGGHFNPTGAQHGLENDHGAHAGDLPNLEVNEAGIGRLNTTTDHLTLGAGSTSLFDADGSAVVIHAGPDDQISNPAGNSGGRVACGVITLQ
ncbi:MAG TPA: superoxide dismutase family protein [Herpetosiphonaceae bacterium]|nr:superoxide dismutase family protein [Herpetosiphonaceae bacterium]